jgi:hypothetical protein
VSAYSLAEWSDFFAAETGAAAALTGLIIVSVSINISTILKFPHLPGRAMETVGLLSGVLVLSTVGMVPGLPAWLTGCLYLGIGAAMWAVTTTFQLRIFRRDYAYPRRWLPFSLGQAASLPIVIAGASLLVGSGGGLYWVVPGIVFAFIAGITSTWVLLVEILR